MNKIFLVGEGTQDLVNSLKSAGFEVGFFKDKNKDFKLEGCDYFCELDFSTKETTLAGLANISEKPDGLVSRFENYLLAKHWIAEHYSLPSPSAESVLASTDKYLMRQKFLDFAPEITPAFSIVRSQEDLLTFANKHSFPLMLKPTNLVKSLLVYKNKDFKELLDNYKRMQELIGGIYAKYNVPREPGIIVEEFLSGSLHSVAAFMDVKGEVHLTDDIVDLVTAQELGKDDNYLFSRTIPTRLSPGTQKELKDVAIKGMQALDLKGSPGHVEIMLTKSGPKIIEIGARIGGYRSRMFQLCRGIDLDKADADISMGLSPDLTVHKNSFCSVLELFPETKGKFSEVTNLEKLNGKSEVFYLAVKAEKGEDIGPARDGFKAALIIILISEEPLDELVNLVLRELKVEITA